MDAISNFFAENPKFWTYLLIPIISGIVGWGTNIIAIKMTFWPLEFIGIPPFFGWQGIIPNKAAVMAGKSVDLLTSKLISVEERFSQIEPDRVAREMKPYIDRLARETITEVMENEYPEVWRNTPKAMRYMIYKRASEDMPIVVEHMMQDLKNNITHFFDVRAMVVDHLTKDKELLNRIFLDCGKEEFKFIERSGLYFGFLFGIIQMVVWIFYDPWWLLPLAGLFVGWATNWLALKMIFEPLEPKKIGPWTIQGLFIKRQHEVATEYAKIVAGNILNSKNIFENILNGEAADDLVNLTRRHVQKAVDGAAGPAKQLINILYGSPKYQRIKHIAVNRFVDELPNSINYIFDYAEEAFDMENTLRERMIMLQPSEFVGVLRPAYQQDEWKLILTGAVLGGLAGFAQLVFLF